MWQIHDTPELASILGIDKLSTAYRDHCLEASTSGSLSGERSSRGARCS
jgi:hypothetical protein